MKSRAQVLIVGKGAFGEAIAELLYESHIFPKFYDKNPETQPDYDNLQQAIIENDIIFFAVPSKSLPDIFESIREIPMGERISVLLSKGFSRLGTSAESFEHFFVGEPYAVLSGPMLAHNIRSGLFAGATLSSKQKDVRSVIAELFVHAHIIMEENSYPRSTALMGALKNIFAFGAGIIHERAWGENILGIYLTQSLREMGTILSLKGYPSTPILGYAGLGDFIATINSTHSCNFGAGKAVATMSEVNTCESIDSFPHLEKHLHGYTKETLPITFALLSISKGKDLDILLKAIRFGSK